VKWENLLGDIILYNELTVKELHVCMQSNEAFPPINEKENDMKVFFSVCPCLEKRSPRKEKNG
jgi:hypothetical protein